MVDEVILREFHEMPDYRALLDVQRDIWGMTYGEATSPYIMAVARHNDGVIIGAEVHGQIVGFCFGFPARRQDAWIHWSHMTGVIPEYQGRGIGLELKLAQRKWALDHGYKIMAWTFDPMQRGNANFNFGRLGVVSDRYIVNHYGEMTDDINAGLASDRLEVSWHLEDEHVVTLLENPSPQPHNRTVKDTALLLHRDEHGAYIRAEETAFKEETGYVEIPHRVNDLKRTDIEDAKRWQLEVRWALQTAFKHGLIVSDFLTYDQRAWYVLSRDH